MFWVAGFDVIYALQDLEFDRAHGLRSIPETVGRAGALRRARIFHGLSFILFASIVVTRMMPVGWLYAGAVGIMGGLIVYEHRLIGPADAAALDQGRFDRAFFHANVGVSTSFFVFTLLDRLFGSGIRL
jgi:4-hydroxybenzoate polyprenyltransferase